jgi:GNAT superfamily N-acetyltransferase
MSPAVRALPDSNSPSLHLTHPTNEEKVETWTLNSESWAGALSKPDYLEREEHLTKAPLAKDGGITHWILVDRGLHPNRRPILASCETLRKRALVSKDGTVQDTISHGIGSVFCDPDYRGNGYASRMMRELGEKLRTWQAGTKDKTCGFSVLWSDIGKTYYAGHGWHPFPSTHIQFRPASAPEKSDFVSAQALFSEDIQALCEQDETLIRQALKSSQDGKSYVFLIPDHAQMQWHHAREDFLTRKILGRQPKVRGAIIGKPGHRIWAVWTRSFYGPIESPASGNTLHILRLVIEDAISENTSSNQNGGPTHDTRVFVEQTQKLKAVIEIAQAQVAEWNLLHIELWNPTPLVQALVEKTNLQHSRVERQTDSIPCLMWYGEGNGKADEVEWVGNEKFGWC